MSHPSHPPTSAVIDTEAVIKPLKLQRKAPSLNNDPKLIYTPTVVTSTLITEEVWDRKGSPAYALRRFGSNQIEICSKIDLGREAYIQVDNGHLRKGMVLVLSEPVPSTFDEVYKDACELAFEIYDCEPP